MNSDDEYFLIVRAVENADPSALWKTLGRPPQEIMIQFLGAGMFETENLASLRIDARHHMLDGAVLAGSIHRLENHQDGVLVACVQHTLQRAEFLSVFLEQSPVMLLRAEEALHAGRPVPESHLLP